MGAAVARSPRYVTRRKSSELPPQGDLIYLFHGLLPTKKGAHPPFFCVLGCAQRKRGGNFMKKSPLKLLYTVACRYLPAYTMRAAKIKRARWLFSAVMAVRAQPPPAIRRKSTSLHRRNSGRCGVAPAFYRAKTFTRLKILLEKTIFPRL